MCNTFALSSGLPHGCVLSPVLFSFYIGGCTSEDLSVKLLKFADSTTVQLFTLTYSWWGRLSVETWGGTAGCLVRPKQPGAKYCKNWVCFWRSLPSSASHQCQHWSSSLTKAQQIEHFYSVFIWVIHPAWQNQGASQQRKSLAATWPLPRTCGAPCDHLRSGNKIINTKTTRQLLPQSFLSN